MRGPTGFITTYLGEAVQWECDELGHLNMRHYMTKASEARRMFFIQLGLNYAFRSGADSTVRTTRFMIRYLKECRPGTRIKIQTGLLSIDDNTAEIIHMMTHHDGTLSAVITETVDHIYLRTGEAFGWPQRVRNCAPRFIVERPATAMARGLPGIDTPRAPHAQTLIDGGATHVGMGVFGTHETDAFQALTPEAFLGRITECVGNFTDLWPEVIAGHASGSDISAALLEIAVYIHDTPTHGEPFAIHSAVQEANTYTRRAAHHIVDPISGRPYASADASGCLFNLKSRRLEKTPAARVAELNAVAIPDLSA